MSSPCFLYIELATSCTVISPANHLKKVCSSKDCSGILMIDSASAAICFVRHITGGAAVSREKAIKMGLMIYDLE